MLFFSTRLTPYFLQLLSYNKSHVLIRKHIDYTNWTGVYECSQTTVLSTDVGTLDTCSCKIKPNIRKVVLNYTVIMYHLHTYY